MSRNAEIAGKIREFTAARGPEKTICPSEVARAVAPGDWRRLMPQIHAVVAELAESGEIEVTQRGRPVDPRSAKGPVRLRRRSTPGR